MKLSSSLLIAVVAANNSECEYKAPNAPLMPDLTAFEKMLKSKTKHFLRAADHKRDVVISS